MSEKDKKKIFCLHGCNTEIHFDQKEKSASGKLIPLEVDGQHHQCPNKEQFPSNGNNNNVATKEQPKQYNEAKLGHIVELIYQMLKEVEDLKKQ